MHGRQAGCVCGAGGGQRPTALRARPGIAAGRGCRVAGLQGLLKRAAAVVRLGDSALCCRLRARVAGAHRQAWRPRSAGALACLSPPLHRDPILRRGSRPAARHSGRRRQTAEGMRLAAHGGRRRCTAGVGSGGGGSGRGSMVQARGIAWWRPRRWSHPHSTHENSTSTATEEAPTAAAAQCAAAPEAARSSVAAAGLG